MAVTGTLAGAPAEAACGTPSGATAGHLASIYSELENAGIIISFIFEMFPSSKYFYLI